MKAITNAKLILPQEIVTGRSLLFTEKIIDIIPDEFLVLAECEEVIDAGGAYLSPGFINLHIHGAAGADTMDGTSEALATMSEALLATGVTSFLPTTMTAARPALESALQQIRQAMSGTKGARVLGCHLEGPYLNPAYKGAQPLEYIVPPELGLLESYADVIKVLTLAPEQLTDSTVPLYARQKGIVLSLGHTGASYEVAQAAIRQLGFSHATHLFNAMSPLHHREPGVVGAVLTESSVTCELIADNIHVHPAAQLLAYKAKGAERLVLITDAIRASQQGEGASELGGAKVWVEAGRATLEDGTLAGSVLTMEQALRNFQANTHCSMLELLQLVTLNPARELQQEQAYGVLQIGANADLTIFDSAFKIIKTIVGGRTLYTA